MFERFTYPFRYVPHPMIVDAANSLISKIKADKYLDSIFSEGKMMGVLICMDSKGNYETLHAFSGLAGGKSIIEGFVPPIFDTTKVQELQSHELTKDRSATLQDELFQKYIVHNALNEKLSVKEVFALRGLVPPGGTGECAAPKLLNYAYVHGLKPLAMGEFWYGASPQNGEVRQEGRFYPACVGKCGPLLGWMTMGLALEENPLSLQPSLKEVRVLFEDDAILVAHKPSGMLCSPGLTGTPSLQEVLEKEHGTLYSCHRLDMDTSGVMVFAKTPLFQANLHAQFASHGVKKTYLARLVAGKKPWRAKRRGTIALPLAPDYYDRPRQIVDKQKGKLAITEFEILSIFPDGQMDVRFYPKTGRTHQLRVHAASEFGLGRPIKGDALYGDPTGERLCLHAESISFLHPKTKKVVLFTSPVTRLEESSMTEELQRH